MKTAKTARAVVAGVAVALAAGAAWGQLVIRPSYPVEAGEAIRMFEGSDLRLPGRGCPGPDPSAARVEIRAVEYALGGTGIVPPTAEGEGDAKNPLIVATRIGAGVVGAQPGRFAVCLPRRALTNVVAKGGLPGNYQGFFARVYDGPTVEESHYYIDSELVGYDPDAAYTNLTFRGAMKALNGDDEQDSDNDGLIDKWEAEYGTDYLNPDTDGDGILDGVEVAHDLDPNSPLSITAISSRNDDPAISSIPGMADSEWHVEWPAGTDLKYKLQLVSDVAHFEKVGEDGDDGKPYLLDEIVVEPSQAYWAQDITEWIKEHGQGNGRGFIRLKLIFGEEEGETGE